MSYRDLVSVIIPVYNRVKMVHEAIESVLAQSYNNIELIIADDGSTDGTLQSLNKYRTYPNVKIQSLDHCGYPGQVRNSAAGISEGVWLAFLDSDDIWLEDKILKQIEYLSKHREYRFIHTLEKWERRGITVSQRHRKHEKEGDLFRTSLGKCEIGPSTVMMDRSLFQSLGGFRDDLEICEDYEFWLRITSDYPVAYVDEELVVKRGGHDDQLSGKYGHIEIFKIEALRKLVDERFFSKEKLRQASGELAGKCLIYSKGCLKRGREKEAKKYESLYFFYSVDDVQR
ncbi:MAG: glycosyltransferase family 2 protein [Spirochaetaceae bacterium]|nr:glycosyltransferase family 2 protein [Spirochaetaceae bacterium]